MMNPVVKFLTTRNGYTFEEGVAVLAMYTKDRNAVERIRRSRDIRLLQHELKKLAHVPGLKPVVGDTALIVTKETVSVPNPHKAVPKTAKNFKKTPKNSQNRESERKDAVTFDDLKHHKYTRYEDMPTPETQVLWKRNNDRWHSKVDLFAKMKLTPEGEELSAIRNELVALSREHREAWKLIDEKCREFYAQKENAEQPLVPEKPSFNISTYRTYICEKANLEKLTDKQFLEVQHRVDAMLQAGIALSEETLKKLRAKGIKCYYAKAGRKETAEIESDICGIVREAYPIV